MTEIKSALELALERTQDIQGDKETLLSNQMKNDGKKLASAFLDPGESVDDKTLATKFKELSGKEQRWLQEGVFDVLVANLLLPINDSYTDKLQQLERGLHTVINKRKQISYIFQQVAQFFSQYIQTREQLESSLKQQYEPQLREKERLLEQQMGAKIQLTHEQDQEFMSLLAKNYAQLEEQYNQALIQVKDQLKQMFG